MNSLDLTKERPSKFWWTSLILYAFFALAGGLLAHPFVTWISSDPVLVEQVGGLYGFAGSTFLTIVYTVWLKKRSIRALGFNQKDFVATYATGLGIGLALAVLVIGAVTLLGGFGFSLNRQIDWLWILLAAGGFFIQGLTEEVLTRGFLFNELAAHKGRIFATVVSALAFTTLHAANPGMTFMPILNLFIFGIFFDLLYWLTDNIWLVGAAHSIRNFSLGPLMGIQVSGQSFPVTVFTSQTADSALINGGSFGVEGSIFTSLFGLAASALVWYLIRKKESA